MTDEIKKRASGSTFKKILLYTGKYKAGLIISIILALGSVLISLYIPILIGKAIDAAISRGNVNFSVIYKTLIFIGSSAAAVGIMQWLMSVINNKITYNTVRDIRNDAFKKIEILPIKYTDSHSHGDIAGRMTADADQLAEGLLMGFTQLFTGVITILGTLIFMLIINGWIALVVILLTPLSLFAAKFIAGKTFSMFRKQSAARGEQTALINEIIGEQKTVKAFTQEAKSLEKFDEINEKLTQYSLKAIFYSSITNPATRFINSIVYAGVALTGALAVVGGGMTVGSLTIFLSYANQYTKPFNEISGVITEFQNALACAARIFELIDEKPQIPEKTAEIRRENIKGRIEFRNVKFSYSRDKAFIQDLNIKAEPGQKIAIIGPTGCGKTTVINLLMRFYEIDSGNIYIEGKDIQDLTRQSLRQSFGMVLQDTWIKNGTIKENIAIGKPDASDSQIIEAAKAAHAHGFIKRLPDMYDTVVNNSDGLLSQGQKQLLCIARIMLCDPPVLILDEATSSIDTRTELQIQDAFTTLMKGRTAFIVAHRLSTIREADNILVMDTGRIKEQGRHNELLDKGGLYAKIYNSQFSE